jgi:hypothetical protein
VLGWCTAVTDGPNDCGDFSGLRWPPAANNNLVSQNYLSGNGGKPAPGFPFPAVDLLYVQFEPASGNCFEDNEPEDYITSYAAPPLAGGPLPADC